MILKIVGSILIVAGCGSYGFFLSASYKNETAALQQLLKAIDYLYCEIQYRRTALPELCARAGKLCSGSVGRFFSALADELERQIVPDVSKCIASVTERTNNLPPTIKEEIAELGYTLGMFDLDGQLRSLTVRSESIKQRIAFRTADQNTHVRNYQTLALCAGAALAILLI